MAGASVSSYISRLLPGDQARLHQCFSPERFYTFSLQAHAVLSIFVTEMARSEKFTLRLKAVKFVMLLRDPTPKPPVAPCEELFPITMRLISHLSHRISGTSFLLIQAIPSSREESCLCTCLQSTRHANGAAKITAYKQTSKG